MNELNAIDTNLPAELAEQQVGEMQGEREQFEAWAKSAGLETKIYAHNEMYSHPVTRGAWMAWQHAAARQPGVQVPMEFAVESKAFEAHAKRAGLNMGQHPLHYLFIDPKTYAARQAWKAALEFAPPAQEDHPYQRIAGLQGIGDAADYLARHPSDDYAKRRLSERITEFCQKHGVSSVQGIDLGQFRPAVMSALTHSSPYGLERENLNRLLALIDRQVVAQEPAPFRFIAEADRSPTRHDMRDRGSVGYQYKPNTTDEGAKE